jgi:methionyl-tRNA formyltransferase
MRIAVIGRGSWLLNSAEKLAESHEIMLVIDYEGDKHYSVSSREYSNFAKSIGARYQNQEFSRVRLCALLRELEIDLVLSSNLPFILRDEVLSSTKFGWLNGHPGPLPRYRGNACPNWAILHGESDFGFVVHKMTEKLDAGPIFSRYNFKITEKTYIGDVYDLMDQVFPSLFETALLAISMGLPGEIQDEGKATECFPRNDSDSKIDWREDSYAIERLIRSYSKPFLGAYCYLDAEKIRIMRATARPELCDTYAMPGQIIDVDSESFSVACGTGFLVVEEFQGEVRLKRRSRLH